MFISMIILSMMFAGKSSEHAAAAGKTFGKVSRHIVEISPYNDSRYCDQVGHFVL